MQHKSAVGGPLEPLSSTMQPGMLALLALGVLAGLGGSAAAGERSLLQGAAPAPERPPTAFVVSYGGYDNYFRSDGVASGETPKAPPLAASAAARAPSASQPLTILPPCQAWCC